MRGQPILTLPRILAVTLLGFSSTLPLSLTGSTLQAWFTQAGMSVIAVGTLSLVGLPYIWKFLWSPFMDKITLPFCGRRRGWIMLTQMGLCVTLFILANLEPTSQSNMMGMLALGIAFISASQDIAIDAYRTDTLLVEERGMGSAYYIIACRIAMIVAGAISLILADHLGWRLTYEFMAVLMGLSILVTAFAPDASEQITVPKTFTAAIVDSFKDLLQRDGIFLIFLFIVLYKIGDAFALSLMSNFLLRGLGFSLTEIAIAFKTMGVIATILGAFCGGILLNRLGLYYSLLVFGSLQAFSNLSFMLLAVIGKNYFLMTSALFIENYCAGMSTTALLVFLTALCHQQYSATQFACLSALAAVGRVFLGPVAGIMVNNWGWANFYAWTFVACLPGLVLLTLLRRKVSYYAAATA